MKMATSKSCRVGWLNPAVLAMVVAGVALPLSADDYSFFKFGAESSLNGYVSYDAWCTAEDASKSSASSSVGIALEAATVAAASPKTEADFGSRTWDESAGTGLKSTKMRGIMIVIE